MNKKLLAVAVAGALAAPGLAFAQAASVTITGAFKLGLQNLSYSGANAADPARLNTSQMRVVDGSSLINFVVVEPLGNGMDAIAKLDVRFTPDAGALGALGNTWVGLRSNSLGSVTVGRWDLHYNVAPGHADVAGSAAALGSDNIALLSYMQNGVGVGANQAVANATRTSNVVKWDSPTWGGFNAIVAWSANPITATGQEADMSAVTAALNPGTLTTPITTSSRKGDGWNVNPSYTNGPVQVGYSFWKAKGDAPTAATAATTIYDQRGDTAYGSYKIGGFKVGLVWNRSALTQPFTANGVGGGTMVAKRDAWSVPLSFNFGPHTILGHYTRANKNKSDFAGTCVAPATVGCTDNTEAKMVALGYLYDFSKRTSVGLTYAKISNGQNASYNLFTSSSLGSADATINPGESPRLIEATIRHAF